MRSEELTPLSKFSGNFDISPVRGDELTKAESWWIEFLPSLKRDGLSGSPFKGGCQPKADWGVVLRSAFPTASYLIETFCLAIYFKPGRYAVCYSSIYCLTAIRYVASQLDMQLRCKSNS